MLIRTSAAACAALLLAAGPAMAEPSVRQMKLANRYMAAANFENMVGTLSSQLSVAMTEAIGQQAGHEVTGELKIAIGESAEETARAMTPKYMQRMAPVIAAEFTEAELEAAVAYLESPAGRSFMHKSPGLMGKIDAALRPLEVEFTKEMEARLCKKVACEPAQAR